MVLSFTMPSEPKSKLRLRTVKGHTYMQAVVTKHENLEKLIYKSGTNGVLLSQPMRPCVREFAYRDKSSRESDKIGCRRIQRLIIWLSRWMLGRCGFV